MLLPALTVHAAGELSSERLQWLRDTLGLTEGDPAEPYGPGTSIGRRSLHDSGGAGLVLDTARIGEPSEEPLWALSLLFRKGDGRPSPDTVEQYRGRLRDVVDRLGLELIEVIPPATADEVADPPSGLPEDRMITSWELPYTELDHMWMHVGLRRDAPREVKEVKLRQVMRTPAWEFAPEPLRSQAERFLAGD